MHTVHIDKKTIFDPSEIIAACRESAQGGEAKVFSIDNTHGKSKTNGGILLQCLLQDGTVVRFENKNQILPLEDPAAAFYGNPITPMKHEDGASRCSKLHEGNTTLNIQKYKIQVVEDEAGNLLHPPPPPKNKNPCYSPCTSTSINSLWWGNSVKIQKLSDVI